MDSKACHPASLDPDTLLQACEKQAGRRSGPGGQHRNRAATAITLHHRETGIKAEASERRQQAENLKKALFRLRLNLALEWRLPREHLASPSDLWQSRVRQSQIHVNVQHRDFPALLAECLDVLHYFEDDLKATSSFLGLSPSQLLKFLKKENRAWQALGQRRQAQGLKKLR